MIRENDLLLTLPRFSDGFMGKTVQMVGFGEDAHEHCLLHEKSVQEVHMGQYLLRKTRMSFRITCMMFEKGLVGPWPDFGTIF